MRAVVLIRVSSTDQRDGYSLDAQRSLVLGYCQRQGITVDRVFELVESAKTSTTRRQFQAMLDYVRANQIQAIVGEKTDRLYRNFRDYVTIDEMDIEVHLVKENEVISKNSTSHTKLVHGIKVLIAKNFIDNLSEESVKGKIKRAETGWMPSTAAYGYNNEPGRISVNPDQAEVVKKIFRLAIAGMSAGDIASTLNAAGDKPRAAEKFARSSVVRILHNTFYMGMFELLGQQYEGAHEALVSPADWQAAQDALAANKCGGGARRRPGAIQFPFQRFLFTPGGNIFSGTVHRGITYYAGRLDGGERGAHNQPRNYIRETTVVAALDAIIAATRWGEVFTERFRSALLEIGPMNRRESHGLAAGINREIERSKGIISRARDAFLSGVLDQDEYTEAKRRETLKIETARLRLAALDNHDASVGEAMERIVHAFGVLPAVWDRSDANQRAELARRLLERVIIHDDKSVQPVWRQPYAALFQPDVQLRLGPAIAEAEAHLPAENRTRVGQLVVSLRRAILAAA